MLSAVECGGVGRGWAREVKLWRVPWQSGAAVFGVCVSVWPSCFLVWPSLCGLPKKTLFDFLLGLWFLEPALRFVLG